MSASREKNNRQAEQEEILSASAAPQEKVIEDKPGNPAPFIAIAAIFIVLSLVAIFWNSGFIQSRATAATVNGENVSVAEFSYYYAAVRQTEYYYSYLGYSTYDSSLSDSAQTVDGTTTYQDYFSQQALSQLIEVYALAGGAKASGYTLSADDLAAKEETMDSMTATALSSGYTSLDSYLVAYYGEYMTPDVFEAVLDDQLYAMAYSNEKSASLTYTDEELDAYYDENKDSLDSYSYDYVILQASQATAAEGEELTDEELAASLEESKAEKSAQALEIADALESGATAADLSVTYDAYGGYDDEYYTGTSLNSSFSEWMMDESRQVGDVTIAEYASTTTYMYYIVRYEGRELNQEVTADVRHILLGAGADPTEEEYADSLAQAESLLAQWESGEATEDSFADLATLYSADSGSAADGGLLSGITSRTSYVEDFLAWCIDSSRETGDTGIVKNEGSSTKGYHLMYFVGWNDPQWKQDATSALATADYEVWYSDLTAGTVGALASGVKYLG